MADEVENLVLEHLRAIRTDIANLMEGQRTTNRRLGAVEAHITALILQ